nr:MAG TPA: hypothetical protein [Microviridae sp.]
MGKLKNEENSKLPMEINNGNAITRGKSIYGNTLNNELLNG